MMHQGLSRYDYEASKVIVAKGHPFYALIAAAMTQADFKNLVYLRTAWPEVWRDLEARYNAPGGVLPGEDGEES